MVITDSFESKLLPQMKQPTQQSNALLSSMKSLLRGGAHSSFDSQAPQSSRIDQGNSFTSVSGATAHRNKLLKKKVEKLQEFIRVNSDLEQQYLTMGRE